MLEGRVKSLQLWDGHSHRSIPRHPSPTQTADYRLATLLIFFQKSQPTDYLESPLMNC